jgi:hypothetical protein
MAAAINLTEYMVLSPSTTSFRHKAPRDAPPTGMDCLRRNGLRGVQ